MQSFGHQEGNGFVPEYAEQAVAPEQVRAERDDVSAGAGDDVVHAGNAVRGFGAGPEEPDAKRPAACQPKLPLLRRR